MEFEAKLVVVDQRIASQVKKGVVEVDQRFFEIAKEEIRDALLEVCDGKIFVHGDSSLVTFDLRTVVLAYPNNVCPLYFPIQDILGAYSFSMFAQRRKDNPTVELDFRGFCDDIENLERFFEFIVIVVCQGRDPCFYLLFSLSAVATPVESVSVHTCFNDMAACFDLFPPIRATKLHRKGIYGGFTGFQAENSTYYRIS